MKIVTYKISLAVADIVDRGELEKIIHLMLGRGITNVFAVEIENAETSRKGTASGQQQGAADVPRKKRKYTRRAKPAEGDDKRTTTRGRAKPAEGDDKRTTARGRGEPAGAVVKDGVVRVKRDDGTMVERRGNCQGGGAQ